MLEGNPRQPNNPLRLSDRDRPSPHLVDLVKLEEEKKRRKEEAVLKDKRKNKIFGLFESLHPRSSAKAFKEGTVSIYEQSKLNSYSRDNPKQHPEAADSVKHEIKVWGEKLSQQTEQLTFFFLFKFIILLFSKLFRLIYLGGYKIYWSLLFALRFIYFSFLAIIKVLKRCLPLFNKTALIIKRGLNALAAAALNLLKQSGKTLKHFLRRRTPSISANEQHKASEPILTTSLDLTENLRQSTVQPGNVDKSQTEVEQEKHHSKEDKILPGTQTIREVRAFRPVLAFTIMLLAIVLPFKAINFYKTLNLNNLKGRVMGASEAAIDELARAAESIQTEDYRAAETNFINASTNFSQALSELNGINDILFDLAALLPHEEIKLAAQAKHIFIAGQAASELGTALSSVMAGFSESEGERSIKETLVGASQGIMQAESSAQLLEQEIANIEISDVPGEYQASYKMLLDKSQILVASLAELANILDKTQKFLGLERDTRYLFVFQNNSELRATGGFIGSYALVDFSEGEIKNIEAPGGGSYDTEGGLKERIIAPEPLHLVNPLWHFWDANWWPDWPTSASKLAWFYEKSGGPTVDGVIGITPTVVEQMLEVVGPIDMSEKYGVIVDSENFWLTVERFAEEKPKLTASGTALKHEPKKIISDLINVLLSNLPEYLEGESLIKLVKIIEQNLKEKHLLLYFNGQELEDFAYQYGWDGGIKQTDWDYLSVVHTNIAGGKSDRVIDDRIIHEIEIQADGSIIDSLTLVRTHTGIKNEEFTGVRNNDWLRVYVPLGSELIEAAGFHAPTSSFFELPDHDWEIDPDLAESETEAAIHIPSGTKIYNEFGKTVFANWLQVDPGRMTTIKLKYKLPFKIADNLPQTAKEKFASLLNPASQPLQPFALLVQKQAGTEEVKIESKLKIASVYKLIWKYPVDLNTDLSGWALSDTLDTDKFWAVLLVK